MNLQQFYYFINIVETGSYTKAAQKLFVTQSSLSHSIADLERELGVPLLKKEKGGIEPTEYGESFLKHAKAIIPECEAITRDIFALKNHTAGKIRISSAHTLATTIVPLLIQAFYEKTENRAIQFELGESISGQTQEALLRDQIDIGFNLDMGTAQLESFPVNCDELAVLVPKNHPWARRDNIAIQELEDAPLITYNDNCGTRRVINEMFRETGITPNIIQECETEHLILGMVSSEMGVAVAPRLQESLFYDVASVALDYGKWKRVHYMQWRGDKTLKPIVRRFLDFSIQYLTENGMTQINGPDT